MGHRTCTALLLLSILFAAPASLSGQSGGLDSMSIAQLKPDRFVRIQVPDLGRVSGRVGARSAGELTLVSSAGDRRVPLAGVDTLWVRGRRVKTGAIIGSIIGLGGGLFLGALADGLCEYDCSGNATVTLGILGVAAGAGSGALIGAAIPRWKRVFPR